MKPLSQHLTDLIALVQDTIRAGYLPAAEIRPFYALAVEIRRIHALPAEGARCTHAAAAVLELFEGIELCKSGEGDKRAPWLMLIGAALPLLRAEAYQQFLNEREVSAR